LVTCFGFRLPYPTCTASYPSAPLDVFAATTSQSSIHSTVSGILVPRASQSHVIPVLIATAPVLRRASRFAARVAFAVRCAASTARADVAYVARSTARSSAERRSRAIPALDGRGAAARALARR
jgi:hypothetical protein